MKPKLPGIRINSGPNEEGKASGISDEMLLEAGKLLKEKRLLLKLSINDLAIKTRISTAVIEAIEKGWIHKLPEQAYLSAMIPRLENELELAPGLLDKSIKYEQDKLARNQKRNPRRLSLSNIDLLTTWQGTATYLVIIFISILAINNQHKRIALLNSESIYPVPINEELLKTDIDPNIRNDLFRKTRPFYESKRKSAIDWLYSTSGESITTKNTGKLKIILYKSKKLTLEDAKGNKTDLANVKGTLALEVFTPGILKVTPPPAGKDQIIWEGEKYTNNVNNLGIYRLNKLSNSSEVNLEYRPQ